MPSGPFPSTITLYSPDHHTMWTEDGHFYTLEVSQADREDAAVYALRASNEYGSVTCKARLVVDSGLR